MSTLPWMQGALHPTWTLIWQLPNGTMKDFTGLLAANFELLLHPLNSTNPDIIGGGTFTIVTNGIVQYQPVSADVSTPGQYQLILAATFPGALPDKTQPYYFQILAT